MKSVVQLLNYVQFGTFEIKQEFQHDLSMFIISHIHNKIYANHNKLLIEVWANIKWKNSISRIHDTEIVECIMYTRFLCVS